MKVVICDPFSGGFEVHRAGCRDIHKSKYLSAWQEIEVDSRSEVCDHVYPPGDFECASGEYLSEFHFLPCCAALSIDESGGA